MDVPTSLAIALVNASAKAISRARQEHVRPHWAALRVADRVERSELNGTTRVPDVTLKACYSTIARIRREQRVMV